MTTLTAHRATGVAADTTPHRAAKRARTASAYAPWGRHAPRPAQRIAMQARHQQDRWQRGW